MKRRINPEIKLRIVNLSKCFWFWNTFYSFYSSIIGISSRELENKVTRNNNKYKATEIILDSLGEEKIEEIISSFYQLKKPFDKEDNPNYQKALEELNDFKELVGDDPIKTKLEKIKFQESLIRKKNKDSIEKEKSKILEAIKNEFYENTKANTQREKQERGYWLERSLFRLLEIESIEHEKPYRTEFEQLDGTLRFKSFDYIIETKWESNQSSQKDISIFEGKLATKGQSTRGMFLSIEGFSEGAINAARNQRGNPRIILITGQEFINVLESRIPFYNILTTKENNLVKKGEVI